MLSPIQEKLLDMLQWFHNFCVLNNICYYAAGGTMIGAARHKGFIPWDDDIDVVVPRRDYNKLISIFQEQKDHYYLETVNNEKKDFLYSYAKLYDTNTTLIEHTKTDCKRGIYIDVFPLDGVGNTEKEAIKNFRKFDRINMFLMMRTCAIRKERSWYKNLSILLARMLPARLVDERKIVVKLDKIANYINRDDAIYVANLMGTYRSKEIILRELFGQPTLYQFENISIYGPEKYDEYLTCIYGDWKALPPENKRKTSHDFIKMDLNNSYMM